MTRTRNRARIWVSQEMLDSLFPEGTTILGASCDPLYGRVEFIVEHEDLPEIPEGAEAPFNNVLHLRVPCECGGTKIVRSWGETRKDKNDAQEG